MQQRHIARTQQSGQGIHGIVGLDVDGGEEEEHGERDERVEERLAAAVPCQQEQGEADAHVAAGKGRRGTLARLVCGLHEMVEESVLPPGAGQTLLVREEIVVQVGEDARCNLLLAYGAVVILRPCYRHEHKNDIMHKEGPHENHHHAFELLLSVQGVEYGHYHHHRIVAAVAQAHQFAEEGAAEVLREEQGRLAAEEALFERGEHMVQVGQGPVQLVGVGIPPAEQCHLHGRPDEDHGAAGQHAVYAP